MARWAGSYYAGTPADPTAPTDVMPLNAVAIDLVTGIVYVGDGATPGGIPAFTLTPMGTTEQGVISANMPMPAGTRGYWPGGMEIAAGVIVDIGVGTVLEVG